MAEAATRTLGRYPRPSAAGRAEEDDDRVLPRDAELLELPTGEVELAAPGPNSASASSESV
jgi:hypothetical protein